MAGPEEPFINAVRPSAESATDDPQQPWPVEIFRPSWDQTPFLRVKNQTDPSLFKPLSNGPLIRPIFRRPKGDVSAELRAGVGVIWNQGGDLLVLCSGGANNRRKQQGCETRMP